MMRLHLVTSRKPLPAAVTAGDTLVFLGAWELIDEVLSDNPEISIDNLRIITRTKHNADAEFKRIDYKGLVELVASCDSVISW